MSKFDQRIHKYGFYLRNALINLLGDQRCESKLSSVVSDCIRQFSDVDWQRLHYYNKLESGMPISQEAIFSRDLRNDKSSAYYYDMRSWLRYFPKDIRFSYLFGDITEVPATPAFLKSRPVSELNTNSVVLKLNQVRHYYIEKDIKNFDEKIPKAVFRGKSYMPWRDEFVNKYFDKEFCDVGRIEKSGVDKPGFTEFMSISDQLNYKYIVSIEGIDVATNLKWILSSNSLCMMRKPRYETWFMEGALEPGVHYAELKDDHSDLEEKIDYYNNNPEKAKSIIFNANAHAEIFRNNDNELKMNIMVIAKYLQMTGQMHFSDALDGFGK